MNIELRPLDEQMRSIYTSHSALNVTAIWLMRRPYLNLTGSVKVENK